jgi:hypothetical protein
LEVSGTSRGGQQVEASILNPKACWDWWGYTGKDFLTKDAPQIAAIWRIVERLARGNKTAKASAAFLERRRTSHVLPNDGGAAD